jgi:hypothetical protein
LAACRELRAQAAQGGPSKEETMFRTTHTIRRLGLALAMAAAATAFAVPAVAGTYTLPVGFQTDTVNSARVAGVDYGLEPWLVTAIQAHGYSLPSGFQTDVLNSARVDSGNTGLDPWLKTAITAHANPAPAVPYSLPSGFQTDTLNSARVAPTIVRVTPGFDWPSFGIGIGAGIGGLLLLAGLAMRVRPPRRVAHA